MRYAIEETLDDNTGLPCWIIVDTATGSTMDRAFDKEDAAEICDFYNDRDTLDLYEDEPEDYYYEPTEFDEWQDFDPDC
jgi:RimJ/RimL family protein N-acetyltransferase